MRTREGFLALLEELRGDCLELEKAARRNRQAWERIQAGATDPIDYGALGFTLHNAYGVVENYFLRVLRFRHRFRNLYGEDLDPAKTEAVQRVASAFFERFRSVHDEFVRKVSAIAESL